jgi:flagellar motility protein MotE (MotC chaperone)
MLGRKSKSDPGGKAASATNQAPGATPGKTPANAPKKRKRRRSGRGVLWTIIAMLVLSGVLRLGGETGLAIANATSPFIENSTLAEPLPSCETEDDIASALALLLDREEKVGIREAAIADRMQALSVAEKQISDQLAALKEAEASLQSTMATASTAAEDDLARLTSVYENMKAKEAVPLFSQMDPQFAAGFLGRMRPDAAAAILAGIDPEKAYTISVLLAGRNARAPTE